MTTLKRGEIALNKKAMFDHVACMEKYIAAMDAVMKEPATVERGRKIAKLTNQLEYLKDTLKHIHLNVPFKKKKP